MPKILIVDDDVTITELMKALMAMEGHQPTVVNDSTQALDVAKSIQPDLITLDVMMPDLSGFDLCKLFREDPDLAKIPIMIISARDDLESMETATRAGAKAYLTKPFGINALIGKIKELTDPS